MLSLILRIVALILFVVAAANETLFGQPPVDLVAWGLGAWVLSTLTDGVEAYFRPRGA